MACIYSRSILHRIHSRKETENVVPRGIECKRDIVRGYTYIFTMGQKVQDVPVTILWCVRVSFSCSDKTLNMNQQCYSEKCFFCFVFKNIASELEVSSDCSPTPLFPSGFFLFFFLKTLFLFPPATASSAWSHSTGNAITCFTSIPDVFAG